MLAHTEHAPTAPTCLAHRPPCPIPSPQLVFAVVALLLLARIIEPIYGSTEFLRLLLVVAGASCSLTFVGAYFLYLTSPDKDGSTL